MNVDVAANLLGLLYIFNRFDFSQQIVILVWDSRCDSASIKRRDKTAACKVQSRFLRGTKRLQQTDGLQPDVREGLMMSVRKWRSTRMGRGGGGLQEAESTHGTVSDFIKAGSCHRGHRWAQ